MLVEAFPRLAVRLQETFPDASVELVDSATSLLVGMPTFPKWRVRVAGETCREHFQIIETSISLQYDGFRQISDDDFNRFIAAENLGLRGASLLADRSHGARALKLRSTFLGQKGRSRDEAENLAVDIVSLLRYARMLEDRIVRSTVYDQFSYEMYYSQYLSQSIGRQRYINYARNMFQGSRERIFGQVIQLFKDDHKYEVHLDQRGLIANLQTPNSELQIVARIPDEIPILTCSALLLSSKGLSPSKTSELLTRLNLAAKFGHFESSRDGRSISFVTWKHLTNDLRLYSIDQMLHSIHEAHLLLSEAMSSQETSPLASADRFTNQQDESHRTGTLDTLTNEERAA